MILEEQYPDVKHTEHQDDVYLIVDPGTVEEVLEKITEIWEQSCGLQVNPTSTEIWAPYANLRNKRSEEMQTIWIPTMKVLGTRTQVSLREEGAALNLGGPEEDSLPNVVEDLTRLQ